MKIFGINTRTAKVWIFENLVDFIGIFISIILAFSLENWEERNKLLEKEAIYLASMYENLHNDMSKMKYKIYEQERKTEACLFILMKMQEGFMPNKDSILLILSKELDYFYPYSPDNSTYESLKYSGDLRLITNSSFKILLSELDKTYGALAIEGEAILDYMQGNQWRGFILDKINLKKRTTLDQTEDFQIRFYNRMTYLHKLNESYYYSMGAALKKVGEVKQALETEMDIKRVDYVKYEEQNDEDY